jgi:transcriptional regulator with XRE-family HTH domain
MAPLTKSTVRIPRPALTLARKSVRLTQQQLARAAGCKKGTISDLEKGRNLNPSHELVVHVFQGLVRNGLSGVSMDELFGVSDVTVQGKRSRGR